MKFCKSVINPMGVKGIMGKLHLYVETIEYHDDQIYRIALKNIDAAAYILLDEKTGSWKAIHYCDNNEKNVSCSHFNVLGFIAAEIDVEISLLSVKNTIKEVRDYPVPATGFKNINSKFGLLSEVEDEEGEEEETSAPINHVSTPVQKRNSTKDWSKIQDYLNSESISPAFIHKIKSKREEISSKVSLLPMMTAPSKPSFPYSGPMLARGLRHVLLGKDLLLIGGKGSGKDTLINSISWVLNLPVTLNVGNKDETKESIVGEPAFRDGESTFDLSLFAKTVQNGGIVNLAEINMLMGDVTSVYHSLLDDNASLPTPIGAIPRNPNFVMMGSMNVGEGYSGVRSLNDAFKDRFAVLRLPYTQNFKEMIKSKTGLHDAAGLSFLEKIKESVDTLIKDEQQGFAASTIRGYIDAANYFLEVGINADSKVEVIEDYVLNKIEDNDEYMALRDMIRQHAWPQLPITPEEQDYMDGVA